MLFYIRFSFSSTVRQRRSASGICEGSILSSKKCSFFLQRKQPCLHSASLPCCGAVRIIRTTGDLPCLQRIVVCSRIKRTALYFSSWYPVFSGASTHALCPAAWSKWRVHASGWRQHFSCARCRSFAMKKTPFQCRRGWTTPSYRKGVWLYGLFCHPPEWRICFVPAASAPSMIWTRCSRRKHVLLSCPPSGDASVGPAEGSARR